MKLLDILKIFESNPERARKIIRFTGTGMLIINLIFLFLLVFDFGFNPVKSPYNLLVIYFAFAILFFSLLFINIIIKLLSQRKVRGMDYLSFVLLASLLFLHFYPEVSYLYLHPFTLHGLSLFLLLVQFSRFSFRLNQLHLNPPLLFAISFLILIIFGTLLLLLPNATVNGISLIDAFFTSTSAVCVTGLIVVDTATYFTKFGKVIIFLLIQIGGLGIMTFTTFFSFFFKGKFFLENQLYVKDFINEERLGQIFKTLTKIIFFTVIFELIGAALIYFSISDTIFETQKEKIVFSIFHSVSAFCNAGFSTFTDGLYDVRIRYNYELQWIIAFLIILGGIGFPVIFNYYKYGKYNLFNLGKIIIGKKKFRTYPRIITINTRIILTTTFVLLFAGTIIYFLLEYNNTLQGLSLYGKITSAFFGAVTPRTAGFNTVDISKLALPTILVYLFLMWVGASPGSTGGGIKTSTLAVAYLTTISISESMDRVETARREIPVESIKRAFSIVFLSFIIIGLSIFLVTIFDSEKNIIQIAFECFSAYNTVGLSMGITGSLSPASKFVIIITMFLGRVGTLTILIGTIRNARTLKYKYPKESILIT